MKNAFFALLPILVLGLLILPVQNAWSQEKEAFTQERFEALQAEGALILLDVFAEWCPTCAKQQELLAAYQDENPDVPLHILQIDFDDQKQWVKKFKAPRRAFTEDNVNEELNRAMRDFTRSEQHIRMDGDVLVISSILDWFGSDFDQPGRPAGDFLLDYMPHDREDFAALRARLEGRTAKEIKRHAAVHFEYDWTVNRAPPNSRAPPTYK